MKESLYCLYIHKTYERVFVLFINTYTKHMKESLYCFICIVYIIHTQNI